MPGYCIRVKTLILHCGDRQLALFREIIADYCENYKKHANKLCGRIHSHFNCKARGVYIWLRTVIQSVKFYCI
jgi:hypothetical protein